MKKFTLFLIVVSLAVFLFLWFNKNGATSASDSPSDASDGSMELVAVRRGDITLQVLSSATITPENKLEIKPPLAGRAESVLVDIGQEVKQGQTLAMMSSTERAALLDAARAKGPKESAYWEDIYKPAPLVAPIDGIVISRTLVPGQVVTTTDVAFIMSDHLIAEASMDETDLAKVSLGQPASVTLDSYPNLPIHGMVSKIAFNGVTSNNVTTYPVEVTMQTIPDFARSGMTANVGFITSERKNVLLLPTDAVNANDMVRLPSHDPDKNWIEKKISTGISDGKNIEIIEGLSEGENVLRNIYRLPEQKKQEGFSLLPRPKHSRTSSSSQSTNNKTSSTNPPAPPAP